MGRSTPAFDDDVGDFAVIGAADFQEFLEAAPGVGHLEQRAAAVMAGTLPQDGRRHAQEHHHRALPQQRAVLGADHRTTTGGEHHVGFAGQIVEGLGFALAKPVLTFDLEDYRNLDPRPRLDLVIGVDETQAEPLGEIDLDDWSGIFVGGGPFNASDPLEKKSPVQQRVEAEISALLDEVVAAIVTGIDYRAPRTAAIGPAGQD